MALIECTQLTKTFKMGDEKVHALNQVSFQIHAGEFLAITGPSGCGKSTLLSILGLLDQPSHGAYHLDGKPVQTLSDNERSHMRNQKIGFVFQAFYLLPRVSALRNVEMPLVYSAAHDPSFSKHKIRTLALEALSRVSLSDRIHHKPTELSGGQRQRVAIGRALVNHPKILFADEPTGNLDSKSGHEVMELFLDLNRQGMTLILVTHDPQVAAFAHRHIIMLDGKIREDRCNAAS
jgi:putative ABC transport system ATP-binding protein